MNLKSIRWRLPFSYAAIALLAALSLGSVMLLVLNGYYAQQERGYLLGNAEAIKPFVEEAMKNHVPQATLQDTVSGLAFLSQTRIRVLNEQGKAIVDTGIPDPNQVVALTGAPAGTVVLSMPSGSSVQTSSGIIQGGQANEAVSTSQAIPEVMVSLTGKNTIVSISASPYGYTFTTSPSSNAARRSSQTVTLPLSGLLGNIEISKGPAYGRDIIRSVSWAWAGAGLVAILLAVLAGWVASRQFTHPVLALTHVTQRMESGDLSVRVTLPEQRPTAEFQALAHSFNNMAQQVENTISTLRAFVADAAHELHTPLTALHTNLELAADETDTSRQTLYLERAQEQSARLEGLVNGLLDLSRIEAAQPGPETGPLVLNQFLGEMAEQLASRAEQANRIFSMAVPEESITISGNPVQLRRIITNLFENSLKFTPPNGAIEIELVRSGEDAILTITDTGIGIPPEDLPHLFERFHRGRNASHYPGSGLGLAITRALVNAHGGSIHAASQPGGGTTVTVRLPVNQG